ncbi:MAG: redoxin domain-containing protein [Gemmatimonadales bacterium]|nr:redoxin domain-containing protein [Gemmatimonadales bacterium]
MDAYRDQYAQLFNGGKDVVLLAISERDTPAELASWAKDAKLPFLMGQDEGGKAGKAYGGVGRSVFVIAPDGTLAWMERRFREVDPTAYTALAAAVKQARQRKG